MSRIDVDKPLYDVNTFVGRFQHFAWMSDPRTCILSDDKLRQAKTLVEQYRKGQEPPGTTSDQVKYAMKLYSSAFHPDSGELQNFAGRMSFQMPGGMIITGAMLAFYRTVPEIFLCQFINQSFNALVNYTNRNANSPTSVTQLGVAYVSATSSALVAALGCKSYWTKRAPPIFQRYVPFAAVAVANCVNIPLMRQNEIAKGIEVTDENGNAVGRSRLAAVKGISQVVMSRITMCAPGMLLLPILMEKIEKAYPAYKSMKLLDASVQTGMVGCFLLFMVPTACALFPQICSLKTSTMKRFEPTLYEEMVERNKGKVPEKVYFNKGL
uniref:Sidoreflexin n=1 Tax=Glossina pallidipes TaxID=7398 RepID=A0A1A9ZBX2_GLOPL